MIRNCVHRRTHSYTLECARPFFAVIFFIIQSGVYNQIHPLYKFFFWSECSLAFFFFTSKRCFGFFFQNICFCSFNFMVLSKKLTKTCYKKYYITISIHFNFLMLIILAYFFQTRNFFGVCTKNVFMFYTYQMKKKSPKNQFYQTL